MIPGCLKDKNTNLIYYNKKWVEISFHLSSHINISISDKLFTKEWILCYVTFFCLLKNKLKYRLPNFLLIITILDGECLAEGFV